MRAESVNLRGHRWSLTRRSPPGASFGGRLGPQGEAPRDPSPPLYIALHGFAGAGEDFAPLIRGPQAIPGEWITIDILGHGRSAAPDSAAEYRMPAVAGALSELVTAVAARPYVVVGYSMGGRLALSALLGSLGGAPRMRPSGLVLIGATPGIDDPHLRQERRAKDEALAAEILARGVPWFADFWSTVPVLAGKVRIEAGHRRAMEARLRGQRAEGLAGSLRGMGAGAMPPLWDALGQLDVPTLLVTGAEDHKFTAIAARMGERNQAIERAVLAGAGHTAHLEAPRAFAAAVARWRVG